MPRWARPRRLSEHKSSVRTSVVFLLAFNHLSREAIHITADMWLSLVNLMETTQGVFGALG